MGADRADRVAAQFESPDDRTDVWRAFELLLDTDQFLNLGYSGRCQTHLVGEPQRRLVDRIGDELAGAGWGREGRGSATDAPEPDRPLLDLGCGRGGPALRLCDRFGGPVVGIDLVPDNLAVARQNALAASHRPAPVEFVAGDATLLPLADDAVGAATAVDALVYVPDRRAVFREVERVLAPDGVCVVSDLVAADGADPGADHLRQFADEWGMAPLAAVTEYRRAIGSAGLSLTRATDLSPHSVGGFRRWTGLYLAVADSPLRRPLFVALHRLGVDPATVTRQVRAAHAALPDLRHVLFTVEPG